MKISIRQSVFETNSSSTHSMTILSSQQIEDLKNNKSKILIHKNQLSIYNLHNKTHIQPSFDENKEGILLSSIIKNFYELDLYIGGQNDENDPHLLEFEIIKNGKLIPSNYYALNYGEFNECCGFKTIVIDEINKIQVFFFDKEC
jgi:hypothetical protein